MGINSDGQRFLVSSTIALGVALLLGGCASAAPDDVRFEVRGVSLSTEEGQAWTQFTHKATVVAFGDSAASHKPYLVMLRVTRKSGGSAELAAKFSEPAYTWVTVVKGVGELEIGGGMRDKETSYQKAETWEPMTVGVDLVGYVPVVTVPQP